MEDDSQLVKIFTAEEQHIQHLHRQSACIMNQGQSVHYDWIKLLFTLLCFLSVAKNLFIALVSCDFLPICTEVAVNLYE